VLKIYKVCTLGSLQRTLTINVAEDPRHRAWLPDTLTQRLACTLLPTEGTFMGDVFLTLYGEDGCSGELQLQPSATAAGGGGDIPAALASSSAPDGASGAVSGATSGTAASGPDIATSAAPSPPFSLAPGSAALAVVKGAPDVGQVRYVELRITQRGAAAAVGPSDGSGLPSGEPAGHHPPAPTSSWKLDTLTVSRRGEGSARI
jgi:hypothetical protein